MRNPFKATGGGSSKYQEKQTDRAADASYRADPRDYDYASTYRYGDRSFEYRGVKYGNNNAARYPPWGMRTPRQTSSGERYGQRDTQHPYDRVDYYGRPAGQSFDKTGTYRGVSYNESAANAKAKAKGFVPPNTDRYPSSSFSGYRKESRDYTFREPQRLGSGLRQPYKPGQRTRYP